MQLSGLAIEFQQLPAPLPMWLGKTDGPGWLEAARLFAAQDMRLIALWGADTGNVNPRLSIMAAYGGPEGLLWLSLPLSGTTPSAPDITPFYSAALRMQRATTDLLGISFPDAGDGRAWLNHGAWNTSHYPLRNPRSSAPCQLPDSAVSDYPFVRVEGDGVNEIPVGPVHAGIIEPGHFRFSIVGEKVLRLEERLGYAHKGIEQRFTQLNPLEAHRLASRVSGDSTVAYGWAYCMALESAAGCVIPARAQWLRALLLERERIANHLGDLGALGNDAALSFGLAQFSRLREDWLRLSKTTFGHRLLMDCIIPGGISVDLDSSAVTALLIQCKAIEEEVRTLCHIYDEHTGLQDRFINTGCISLPLARQLGLTGLAGRASGIRHDLRCDQPWAPYQALKVIMATHENGDIAARVAVRFAEVFESLRLIRALLAGLPSGALQEEVNLPPHGSVGAGWVEGWRGEIFVALELSDTPAGHRIERCHCHDPSWQNWPALEHAVIGNIVPDFPLINKSFNLSYSGQDL
jgi:Ni,Fe-hydrogenase III large subunit/Ni,Fe-hydrogenase III component G